MSADIEITEDNSDEILNGLSQAKQRALEIIGQKLEKYAKALCPVGTVESTGKKGYRGGTLRGSITHGIENEDTVYVGTNVEYAPYVELGTGPNFTPPPEWEDFTVTSPIGVGHGYVRPRPFLSPAITDHKSELEDIFRQELS